jgi:hypothetical protein
LHSTYNNDIQVFEDACRFLRAMKRLTHLSGFASELNVLDANQTKAVLRRFADACPTLAFVELPSPGRNAPSRWVTIKQRIDDGTCAGWNSMKSLGGTHMEDWGGHLDLSTPNLNWDKRILTFG